MNPGAQDITGSIDQDTRSLVFSLRVIAEEAENRSVQRSVNKLADRLEQGDTWDQALARSGKPLPAFLRGGLELQRQVGPQGSLLTDFFGIYRRVQRIRRQVYAQLWYPIIVLGIVWGVVLTGFALLSGNFQEIFNDFGVVIPVITQVSTALGEFVRSYWLVIVLLGLLVPVPLLALRFVSLPARLARGLQTIPLSGTAFRHLATGEFCLMLSALTEARIPLTDSFRLLGKSLGDSNLREGAREMAKKIEGGDSPAYASLVLPNFPERGKNLFRNASDERLFAESLQAQGEICLQLASLNALLLDALLRPVLLTLAGGTIALAILSWFLPLIRLLNELS